MFFVKERKVSVKILPQAKAIRSRRIELKMSLRQFARYVKVSATYILRIENGNIRTVSRELAMRMNKVLKNGRPTRRNGKKRNERRESD